MQLFKIYGKKSLREQYLSTFTSQLSGQSLLGRVNPNLTKVIGFLQSTDKFNYLSAYTVASVERRFLKISGRKPKRELVGRINQINQYLVDANKKLDNPYQNSYDQQLKNK